MEQDNQEQPLYVPRGTLRLNRPAEQAGIAVSSAQWDGLINRIQKLKPDFRPLTVAYSIFFGIGATAGLSIAPLLMSGIAGWVIGVYAGITISGFAFGAALLVAERLLGQQQSSQIAQLISEMNDLKDEFI